MLVDTSVWIAAVRGAAPETDLVDGLLAARRVATNLVIVAELRIGVGTAQEFREFSDDLSVLPHLSLTEGVWEETSRLGFGLRRKGVTVPLPDLLIAACAMVHGCELWSADHDFTLIARHAPLTLYRPTPVARSRG